ncbi:Retrovirus-related Pol polyprotein, partial [Mucuna pruriens]
MKEETSWKGSTLILGRPFFMTARTKIDVHVGTLSMEFGDNLVQFNIFEAMKHPIEDHSLFVIDLIDELVAEHLQLDIGSDEISNFAGDIDVFDCLGSITDKSNYNKLWEVLSLFDSENDDIEDLSHLSLNSELVDLIHQVCKYDEESESSKSTEVSVTETKKSLSAQVKKKVEPNSSNKIGVESNSANLSRNQSKVEIMSAHLVSNLNQVRRSDPKPTDGTSSSPSPPAELKSFPDHLKYAYLGIDQIFPKEKLLHVLRQHRKAIGWKLSNLPSINPTICMHRILMEEEAYPIRQQQRRLNPTILDMVKKEVTKLLAVGIIYPISDSQWVSPVQVVPKKSGMTHDELVPLRIRNSWRVYIDYRKLNQATRKDHFPLSFIDQVLEKLARKSHYYFLDGFSRYMQIHIAPDDQHTTTFTCPFDTFAYIRMSFGLCYAPSTFQCCMTSIFSDLLQDCMEVFMDDFMVYAELFDACLENLYKVLTRCIDTNLVLNFKKCHFMVTEGVVLRHLVSSRGIEVNKSKIDIITSFPNHEVRSFLGHVGFYRRFIKNFSKIALPLSKLLQKELLQKEVNFTFVPILQAPNWEYPFELMCDSSNSALGAVLGQRARIGKQVHELLAIVFTLDKFRSYLLGPKIIIFFDHAALRFLLKKLDAKPRLI